MRHTLNLTDDERGILIYLVDKEIDRVDDGEYDEKDWPDYRGELNDILEKLE